MYAPPGCRTALRQQESSKKTPSAFKPSARYLEMISCLGPCTPTIDSVRHGTYPSVQSSWLMEYTTNDVTVANSKTATSALSNAQQCPRILLAMHSSAQKYCRSEMSRQELGGEASGKVAHCALATYLSRGRGRIWLCVIYAEPKCIPENASAIATWTSSSQFEN